VAEIIRGKVRDFEPGTRILDHQGRAYARLDDVYTVSPLGRMMGMVAVCDMDGNVNLVPGSLEATGITLDPIDDLMDSDGEDAGVILRGWQASVN
jgi:hypothetical protein